MRKKAFTLIELIAVLVILAILALIVTPLVMNIIRKARVSADKRSVDAYGRSVELAIANYLLDNGGFPTDISQLTIEYSGDRVECSTTQLNSDSTVYLAGCTVRGRNVDYAYGTDKSPTYTSYSVGDEITYNGIDFYVIKDSSESETSVTMLKAEPLTVEELNKYGINHLNNYVDQVNNIGTATSDGRVAYYSSDVCGYYNSSRIVTGCTNDYNDSDIKYILDKWSDDMLNDTDLVNDKGYKIRLITLDEVINLGYEWGKKCEHCYEGWVKTSNAPNWLYNSKMVWTMTPSEKDNTHVWFIYPDGALLDSSIFSDYESIYNGYGLVRPVITLKKSALN